MKDFICFSKGWMDRGDGWMNGRTEGINKIDGRDGWAGTMDGWTEV